LLLTDSLPPDVGSLKQRETGTHLKNRILAQDRCGAGFQTAGNLWVVEDLKRGTNPPKKAGGRKTFLG